MDSVIENRGDYVYLKFSGDGELKDFKKALLRSNKELNSCKEAKMMVDFFKVNFHGIPNRKRIVFAMVLFDILKICHNNRIAILIDSRDYDGTVKEYSDMRPFGLDVFHGTDEAVEWLQDETEDLEVLS